MHQEPHFEHRVREFAYQIWESEGKPDGQAERHWEMACKLAEAHNLGQQLLNGDAAPAKTTRSRKKAEPDGADAATTLDTKGATNKEAKAEKAAKAAKAEKPAKTAKAAEEVEKPKKAKKTKASDASELTAN
jgi:hypothetical protein